MHLSSGITDQSQWLNIVGYGLATVPVIDWEKGGPRFLSKTVQHFLHLSRLNKPFLNSDNSWRGKKTHNTLFCRHLNIFDQELLSFFCKLKGWYCNIPANSEAQRVSFIASFDALQFSGHLYQQRSENVVLKETCVFFLFFFFPNMFSWREQIQQISRANEFDKKDCRGEKFLCLSHLPMAWGSYFNSNFFFWKFITEVLFKVFPYC